MRQVGAILAVSMTVLSGCGKYKTPAASVPGGHLVFVDGNGRLAGVATDGSGLYEITPLGGTVADPALTRNGSAVAFAYDPKMANSTVTSIYMADYGSAVAPKVVVTAGPSERLFEPAWDASSPPNLYYLADTGGVVQVRRVTVNTSISAPVVVSIGSLQQVQHLAVVDDHTLLLTADASADLFLLDTTNHTSKDLALSSTIRPAVSPDGGTLVFLKSGAGLATYNLASKQEVSVYPAGKLSDVNPCFSPDGAYISFDTGSTIYSVRVTGTDAPLQLHTPGSNASWGS